MLASMRIRSSVLRFLGLVLQLNWSSWGQKKKHGLNTSELQSNLAGSAYPLAYRPQDNYSLHLANILRSGMGWNCVYLHVLIVLMLQRELGDAQESGVDIVVVLGRGFEIRNVALGDAPVFCFLLRNLCRAQQYINWNCRARQWRNLKLQSANSSN